MEIKPTYVTIEQGTLLKEKGCLIDGYLQDVWIATKYEKKNGKFVEVPIFGLGLSSKLPEQWQVVEWLRIEHGIWVSVDMIYEENQIGFWYCIRQSKIDDVAVVSDDYLTPQEAYSSAIDYVLNNLI